MITRKQLAYAFFEVLEGQSHWQDIQAHTGLPQERCKEISELFDLVWKEFYVEKDLD